MNKMKRGLKQTHHVDVDAKERMKHQNLLQEYMQLQKEFVSKKKRLQTVQEKRDTLSAEVRFLRARHGYLLKIQHNELEIDQSPVQTQNSSKQPKMLSKDHRNKPKMLANHRICGVNEAVLKQPLPLDLMPITGDEKDDGGKTLEVEQKPARKKPKNCLINDKKVGKKKISWQDPVSLQV